MAIYDWSPLFDAINKSTNDWSQRGQYNAMLNQLVGTGTPAPVTGQAPPQTTQMPSMQTAGGAPIGGQSMSTPGNISVPQVPLNGSLGANAPMNYNGPAGQALGAGAASLLPMLRNAPPGVGLPLLLNLATKNAERQQNIQDARITPLSDDEAKAALGASWKPDAKYGRDISGNIVTTQKGETLSDAAVQQQYGMERQKGVIAGQAPLTQAQIQEHKDRMAQVAVTANQPHFVPYGTTSYIQNGKQIQVGGAGGGASPFGNGDPASPSINGQTGLSSMGMNYITGNTSQMGPRDKAMASKEVDNFIARTGLDSSTVKPQVQAFQSAVNINTLKANTMDTLAKEVVGTVQNYGPVIDQLTGNGNLRLTNRGFELFGSAVNDPTAQKAIFYLNQMRADMAGFNAASGGKIGLHGQVGTDNADFAKADEVIKNGLSSGGAKALAEAVEATRQKNVAVAQQQVVEANRGIWNALGVGKNFDAIHGKGAPNPGGQGGGNSFPPRPSDVPANWQPHTDAKGNKAYVSPDGKQYREVK